MLGRALPVKFAYFLDPKICHKETTMKRKNNLPGPALQSAAAAVLLALGSSVAVAQQGEGSEDASEQQQSQLGQESERSAQQDAGQQEGGIGQAGQASEDETEIARAGDAGQGGSVDLDQLTEEHGDIAQFIEAVRAAGMEESLTQGTPYTVFAPTDDALEQMSGMDLEELMQPQNRDQLVSLLRAHIVADDVDSQMARSLGQAQTIDGGTIEISESDGELMVGDASVVEPDIRQGSLTVHAIDQVLSEGRTQTAALDEQPQSEEPRGGQSPDQSDTGQEPSDRSDAGQEPSGQSDVGQELEQGAEEAGRELEEAGQEAERESESLLR